MTLYPLSHSYLGKCSSLLYWIHLSYLALDLKCEVLITCWMQLLLISWRNTYRGSRRRQHATDQDIKQSTYCCRHIPFLCHNVHMPGISLIYRFFGQGMTEAYTLQSSLKIKLTYPFWSQSFTVSFMKIHLNLYELSCSDRWTNGDANMTNFLLLAEPMTQDSYTKCQPHTNVSMWLIMRSA